VVLRRVKRVRIPKALKRLKALSLGLLASIASAPAA